MTLDPTGALAPSISLIVLSGVLHLVRNQAASGRIERNSAVGIRTKATRRSDDAWLAGHQAASPWLLVTALTGYGAGATALVLALALLATDATGAVALALAGYVAVVVLLIISTRKANAAAAATP